MLKATEIPLDDYETWKLIQSGKTIGVFQCESQLVQSWLRKIRPQNIWELSAAIALVRPGALDTGMAHQYVENKESGHNESFGNDIIDNIFKSTYGVLTYQESLILLGQRLAWQHLPEIERDIKSDELRKAVGKKDQSKILAIGKEFVDGCTHNKVDPSIADKLFEIIKSCGRYLFNLSHSMSYAYVGYKLAYLKYHHPLEFYIASLNYSDDKNNFEDELHNLIQDAKAYGFVIESPNINNKNLEFSGSKATGMNIRYGLRFIKYVGSSLNNIINNLPIIKSWHDVLRLSIGGTIRSNAIDALIWSNAFVDAGLDRSKLFTIINFCRCLTERESNYLIQELHRFPDIQDFPKLISEISSNIATKRRVNVLNSETIILEKSLLNTSNPIINEQKECFYLGSVLSECASSKYEAFSTHNCYKLNQIDKDDKIDRIITLCVVDDIKTNIIKTGKNQGKTMAKITIHDSSGEVKGIPIFSDSYNKYMDILVPGKLVQLQMRYNSKFGLSIQNVSEICC